MRDYFAEEMQGNTAVAEPKDYFAEEVQAKNPAFLPNANKVEEQIAGREDSMASLRKELQTDWNPLQNPIKAAVKPLVEGLKVAAVPFQRAEAAVAGAGLAAQKGDFGSMLSEAGKGLAGEKSPQLGDIIRTTGFGGKANEALAAGVGLAGALPVFGGVEAGVAKTAGAIGKAAPVSKASQWMSDKLMSEYLKPKQAYLRYGKRPESVVSEERIRATSGEDLLNKIQSKRQEVGKEIGSVAATNTKPADYSNAIKVIDDQIAKIQKDSPKVMKGLIQKLKDKKSDLLHEVTDANGNVVSVDDVKNMTLKDAHDLKDRAIHNATTNVFSQTANEDAIFNETMRNVYRQISRKMTREEPKLLGLNRRYANLTSADKSLTSRLEVAARNNNIVSDAAHAGMGAVVGHIPGAGAGYFAGKVGQTALYKTNASMLLSDIDKGVRPVEEILAAFAKAPAQTRRALQSANANIQNGISEAVGQASPTVQAQFAKLGIQGKVGSGNVIKAGEAEILDPRMRPGLPAPSSKITATNRLLANEAGGEVIAPENMQKRIPSVLSSEQAVPVGEPYGKGGKVAENQPAQRTTPSGESNPERTSILNKFRNMGERGSVDIGEGSIKIPRNVSKQADVHESHWLTKEGKVVSSSDIEDLQGHEMIAAENPEKLGLKSYEELEAADDFGESVMSDAFDKGNIRIAVDDKQNRKNKIHI